MRKFFHGIHGIFKHPLFPPLVIYILFFPPDPGSIRTLFDPVPTPAMPSSVFEELFQVFVFYIPATALVLYFCFQDTPDLAFEQRFCAKRSGIFASVIKTAIVTLVSAAALLLIGGLTIFVEKFFAEPDFSATAPESAPFAGIFVIVVFCVAAAYLEESFFRLLLYRRLLISGLKKAPAVLVSSLMFAACHAWEGVWGMTGALLSGIFLAFLFERKKSLNIVSLSHALYNITVYLLHL